MITIEINDDAISQALGSALGRLDDMTPVMQAIGRQLQESTIRRFAAGQAPDGTPWAANSPVTLARKRDPRPLFGISGMLNSQISYEADASSVQVGSNRIYAAMMQFGGTKAKFPHLWGNIPARPFLGISDQDQADILDIIGEALEDALTP